MLGKAALKIIRMAPVKFAGRFNGFENIRVKHRNYKRWPAIRSPEPDVEPALLRSQGGAMEGTILRPELGSGRRMVEAAGVEPASLAN